MASDIIKFHTSATELSKKLGVSQPAVSFSVKRGERIAKAEALIQCCWPKPEVPENVNTAELGELGLAEVEEDAIVAFMKMLTDGFEP